MTATILVVEDERIIAGDLQQTLIAFGYAVPLTVTTGAQAIAAVAESRPDLVLMDISLSGAMDGIEASREIRRHADVPVVYLTSYSDEATLIRALKTGPHGYLLKPFSDRELRITIEVALSRHQMEARPAEPERLTPLASTAGKTAQEITTPLASVMASLAVTREGIKAAISALRAAPTSGPTDEILQILLAGETALDDASKGAERVKSIVRDLTRLDAAHGTTPHVEAGATPAPPARRGRMLIIDDDAAVARALSRLLRAEHEVEVFADARAALLRLEQDSSFDAIFCDLMMPDMTGMDFHTALASAHPELGPRVVFMSGGTFSQQAQEFLERTSNVTIPKPFVSDAVRKLAREHVK